MGEYVKNCGECFFFRNFKQYTRLGECHKNPPQVVLEGGYLNSEPTTMFPKVSESEWCGCGISADTINEGIVLC
jgi:hypothetical protein